MCDKVIGEEILLNRVYSGNCYDDDLGREAINLLRDDKGDNYIYVLPHGAYGQEHFEKIKECLLVRGLEGNRLEVLAKATQLEAVLEKHVLDSGITKKSFKTSSKNGEELIYKSQLTKLQSEYSKDIKYNGIPVSEIFKNYDDKRFYQIFITFKAGNYKKPIKPIYLTIRDSSDNNEEVKTEPEIYNLDATERKRLNSHYLANFISKENELKNYNILKDIIEDGSLWEIDNSSIKVNEYTVSNEYEKLKDFYFLEAIRKDQDEIVFSNMFAYFLKQDKKLCKDFLVFICDKYKDKLKNKSKNIKIGDDIRIYREYKNIDLLMTDEENVVVIENKINSKINGLKYDDDGIIIETQLNKYINVSEQVTDISSNSETKTFWYFIFTPKYNDLTKQEKIIKTAKLDEIKKTYCVIRYDELYNFFKKEKYFNNKGNYYKEFVKGLSIHSKEKDDYHFDIMMRKFLAEIEKK